MVATVIRAPIRLRRCGGVAAGSASSLPPVSDDFRRFPKRRRSERNAWETAHAPQRGDSLTPPAALADHFRFHAKAEADSATGARYCVGDVGGERGTREGGLRVFSGRGPGKGDT